MADYIKQMFAAPEGTIITTDLEPAVSIDHNTRLVQGIQSLQTVLGITEMTPFDAGNSIKIYRYTKTSNPAQVGEGEEIGLTHYERKLAKTYDLTLQKYRKSTTIEAIQRVGRSRAVNDTDELLVRDVQKDVKGAFFDILKMTGTSTVEPTNTGLQSALAAAWGQMATDCVDMDVTPVYFVHPLDIAGYLETAQVTIQTSFGFKYIADFLGLGTVVIDPSIGQGAIVATCKENLNGVYVPASGDASQVFGLTADQTGIVGMTHYIKGSNATVETLIVSGCLFYPEDLAKVYKAEIKTA